MKRVTPLRTVFAVALVVIAVLSSQRVYEVEAHSGDSFAFSAATYDVVEGAGTSHTVTIKRTQLTGSPSGHNVVVSATNGTAIEGTHFAIPSNPFGMAFGSGESSLSVPVTILDDGSSNADRTFTLTITLVSDSGTIGAQSSAVITIIDDESLPPDITSMTPTNGSTLGGTVVTINGSGFTGVDCTGPDVDVTFGGIDATSCTVVSDTKITATAPTHASGQVQVVVTSANGASTATPLTANDFLYVTPGAPTVSGVTPASGPVGQSVTISGTGFTNVTSVTFNGQAATFTVGGSGTTISATAPDPANGVRPLTVDVVVTANAMTSTITGNSKYTYAALTVSALSPNSGPEGTTVVITGTGFTSLPEVFFNAVQATVVNYTPTTITVTAPVPASTQRPHVVDVIVGVGNDESENTVDDDFTYVAVTLTGVAPVAGPAGTEVTISGSGFRGTPVVKFGDTTATTVTDVTNTSLKVVAPAHPAGKVDVIVTSGSVVASPTSNTVDDFTYTAGVTVSGVNPVKGPTAGGNTVVITGSGFDPVGEQTVTVLFGTTPATSFTLDGNTQITAVAPARTAGTISIKVTVNGVPNADTDGDDYTYADLPVITALNPTTSVAGQTTIVKITGVNFTGTSKVTFGTLESLFTVNGDGTEITVATPGSAPAGTVDVFVTNPAGTSVAGPQTLYTFTGSGGAPAVTGLSPSNIPINTSGLEVTITGVNFAQGATVKFGSEVASGVQVLTSTSMKAVAPSRTTAGTVDVTVTTAAGTSTTAGSGNDFTYTAGSGPTTNVTYSLYVRFTLITWDGKEGMAVGDALRGLETPIDSPTTNNVTSATSAVFTWSPNGAGCSSSAACWLGYFPSGAGVPGANNLSTLVRGGAYWVAVTVQTTWVIRQGP